MFELDNVISYAAIARDLAFVILCIVSVIAVVAILIAIRKATRRFDETMDRVDSLLDSILAIRDALAEAQQRMREYTDARKRESEQGFNVASWLFSPLKFFIKRKARERAEAEAKSSNS